MDNSPGSDVQLSLGLLQAELTRAALRQRAFRRLQSRRSDTICRSMSNYAEQAGLQIEITSGFSDDLVQSAFGAFIVALLATVVMWLYVVYR